MCGLTDGFGHRTVDGGESTWRTGYPPPTIAAKCEFELAAHLDPRKPGDVVWSLQIPQIDPVSFRQLSPRGKLSERYRIDLGDLERPDHISWFTGIQVGRQFKLALGGYGGWRVPSTPSRFATIDGAMSEAIGETAQTPVPLPQSDGDSARYGRLVKTPNGQAAA